MAPSPAKERPTLSLIVPLYDEAQALNEFFAVVIPILDKTSEEYEVICVNDGSQDETLPRLLQICQANPRIKVINLTRNFGKEAALTAGLDFAQGDAVIPIDVDLQDPPELIPVLIEKWRQGYDMVTTVRKDRRSDSIAKRLSADIFYRLVARMSVTPIPPHSGDYRLMDRKVVDALKQLPERTRFMKGLFGWLGFQQTEVPYERPSRSTGQTKWNYWKLWNLGLEGIFSFSTLPLRIWTYIGGACALFSLAYLLFIFVRTLMYGADVPGYPSLITVMLFFSGLNMMGLGILGEYLGRVFIEVKQRPLYLVHNLIGFENSNAEDASKPFHQELSR
jgi:glycosyltransferase involved in cell wall biosynthesis